MSTFVNNYCCFPDVSQNHLGCLIRPALVQCIAITVNVCVCLFLYLFVPLSSVRVCEHAGQTCTCIICGCTDYTSFDLASCLSYNDRMVSWLHNLPRESQ